MIVVPQYHRPQPRCPPIYSAFQRGVGQITMVAACAPCHGRSGAACRLVESTFRRAVRVY